MIYCMIDTDNTYDYENELETTEDLDRALEWIENGECKEVAILDGCSLGQVGTLDIDDVYDRYMDDLEYAEG